MADQLDAKWNGIPLAITNEGASRLAALSATDIPPYPGEPLLFGQKAVIKVHGPIMGERFGANYADIVAAAHQAEANAAVSEIEFDFNSPGGLLTGVFEAARAIRALNKPTTARISGEACSAAYWLAAACNTVVCCPTAVVGSLGVIYNAVEAKEELMPVRTYRFTSSATPFKAAPPSSEGGIEQFQALVDAQCGVFLDEVASYRGVTRAIIESRYGNGRILDAKSALTAGMIDSIYGAEAPKEQVMVDEEKKVEEQAPAPPAEEAPKDEELKAGCATDKSKAVAPADGEMEDDMEEEPKESPEDRIKFLEDKILQLTQKLEEYEASKADAGKSAAQIAALEMKAAIEPLLAAGKITPAERPKAEAAFKAQAANPELTVFTDFYASREAPIVQLNTRISDPNAPSVQPKDPNAQWMNAALAYAASHNIDPNGPNFVNAVLAVQAGLA